MLFDNNGIGSVAQSGCCRRQAGVKSEKRKKDAKKSRQGEERTLDDNPKRRCETLECKLGIQVERGRYTERGYIYVSKPGTDKNCSLTISGGDAVVREKISSTKFSSRASDLTRSMFHRYNDSKKETGETRSNSSARLSTAIHF